MEKELVQIEINSEIREKLNRLSKAYNLEEMSAVILSTIILADSILEFHIDKFCKDLED